MSGTWNTLIKVCVYTMEDDGNDLNTSYMDKFKSLINSTTESGSTPLHFVALGQNIKLATWLFEKGAIVVTNEDDQTPLHWACKNGCLPMVQLLLNHMTKEQIKKKDFDGTSALDWAKEYEHDDIKLAIEEITSKKKIPLKRKTNQEKKCKKHNRVSALALNLFKHVK